MAIPLQWFDDMNPEMAGTLMSVPVEEMITWKCGIIHATNRWGGKFCHAYYIED